jgi:hypothetical protein
MKMANGEQTQEEYLSGTGLEDICIRGIKKLVTEVTSIKTLAMAGFFALLFLQKLDGMTGVVAILGCLGAKEVDFTQVIEIVKTRFGGGK